MASRISSLWNLNGPTFTLSSDGHSVSKALEVASLLLANHEIEAILVGAVDLAGSLVNVLLHNELLPVNTGAKTLGFGEGVNGWTVGEGAGAVLLKRPERAKQDGDRVYSIIESAAMVQNTLKSTMTHSFTPPLITQGVTDAAQAAMKAARVTADHLPTLAHQAEGTRHDENRRGLA